MKRNKKSLKNKENLEEDLHNMSVEDIMDCGFNKHVAQLIYDAEHDLNMDNEQSSYEEFVNWLENL